jgi:hypothetical protein
MVLAAGLVAPAMLVAPAGAAETTFSDTCEEVYGRKAIGDLEKSTDPVAGTAVGSGDTVSMTLQWPNTMVAGNRAHRVLECLSVDGSAPSQWAERKFTTDQGTVSFQAVVPSGLSTKSTVCSQSFLKTQGPFGPVTRWSEKTCFPVGPPGSFHALSRIPSPPGRSQPSPESRENTPTTRGPLFSSPPSPPSESKPYTPPSSSGDDYQPPWPPWEKAPRVAASPPVTTPTTSKATTTPPRKAQGSELAAPAGQTSTRAPSQTLPRTGAGVVVLMAVAAVALFSGRTLRKTAHHIEDNLPVEALPVDDDGEPTLVLGRRW